MIKISKRIVEALETQGRDVDHFDEDLKGFGVRVRSSGRKTYFVMMRHKCVMRRFTIGSHGSVTAELARLKAKQIISDLAIDKNPTEVEDAVRPGLGDRRRDGLRRGGGFDFAQRQGRDGGRGVFDSAGDFD